MVLSCRPATEAALFSSTFPVRRWEWIQAGRMLCPVRLLLGDQSQFGKPGFEPSVPAYFDALFRAHPDYTRASFPGTHMAPLERPKPFAAAVARHVAGAASKL